MNIKIGDKIKWVEYSTIYTIKDIDINGQQYGLERQLLFEWVDGKGDIIQTWSCKVDVINRMIEDGDIIIMETTETIEPNKKLKKLSFK